MSKRTREEIMPAAPGEPDALPAQGTPAAKETHGTGNLFKNDPLDPKIAKLADRTIDLMGKLKETKEKLADATKVLTVAMRNAKLTNIRHGGYKIKIDHKDAKDGVKVTAIKIVTEKKPKRKKKEAKG